MPETTILSPQDALVAVMLAVSVADETIRTSELVQISNLVENLPIFADYDQASSRRWAPWCWASSSARTASTACSPSCAATCPSGCGRRPTLWPATSPPPTAASPTPEGRMLEEIRDELGLDRLHAAAIERGARARFQTL
jgi:hypothetical protein